MKLLNSPNFVSCFTILRWVSIGTIDKSWQWYKFRQKYQRFAKDAIISSSNLKRATQGSLTTTRCMDFICPLAGVISDFEQQFLTHRYC